MVKFITLLEQNIIIHLFQGIPLIFMAAILKTGIRIPLGILNGFWQDKMTLKKKKFITLLGKFITLSGSITLLVDFYYIIGKDYIIGSLLHYWSKIL